MVVSVIFLLTQIRQDTDIIQMGFGFHKFSINTGPEEKHTFNNLRTLSQPFLGRLCAMLSKLCQYFIAAFYYNLMNSPNCREASLPPLIKFRVTGREKQPRPLSI